MIEIKIPKEIKDYKSKLFFNLTVRQLVCSGAAIAICVPLYIWGNKFIDEEIVSWLIMIIAAPLFFMGFFKFNGMTFELFAKEWFLFNFENQRRKYEYEPIYCEVRKCYLYEDLENEKISRNDEIKREKKERRKNRFKKGKKEQ